MFKGRKSRGQNITGGRKETPLDLKNPIAHAQLVKAKVIYNLVAGREDLSPTRLADVLVNLQDAGLVPEVYMVDRDVPVETVIADALRSGIRLFVVCGGDGTLDRTVPALINTPAVLAVVPTGTQNNAALTFGIPLDDIPAAVSVLKQGKVVQVDTGLASGSSASRTFLEVASLGLTSALFEAADEFQHGDLTAIADLVGAFVSFPASTMRVTIDEGLKTFEVTAHTAVVANLPYTGTRLRLIEGIACDDGLLDLFLFSEMSKADLIPLALRTRGYVLDDPRIQHMRVRSVRIHPSQPMPVIADGIDLGDGDLIVQAQPRTLNMIASQEFGIEPESQESAMPDG